MIVPMFKYSFLVYHADYDQFLKHLKEIGVAHIVEHQNEPTTEMQDLYRKISDLSKTLKTLERRRKQIPDSAEIENITDKTGETLNQRIAEIESRLEETQQHLSSLQKEEKQIEPWGQFSLETIKELSDAGINLRFLFCPSSKYNPSWEEQYPVELISETDGYCYFVFVEESGSISLPEEMQEVDEVELPKKTLNEVQKEINETQAKTDELNRELDSIAIHGIELLERYQKQLEEQLADLNVKFQTVEEVEGKIRLIEAWVPEEKTEELEKWVDKLEVYYLKEAAHKDEKPPILLRNNRFARLFEPVGKLFSLPSYAELDLTPFFAPFFMLFYGFCLGDAGYGLLLLLAITIYKPKAKPEMRPLLSLAQLLGLSTILFGAITGTFFGINLMENPPEFLMDAKDMFLDNNQLFMLALAFGAIQILFGMVLKAINQIRQQGFAYSLSTWGWFILISSSAIFYLIDSQNPEGGYFFGTLHQILVGISLLGIFVFNHPKRNIFINIGTGLWDAYNKVTGVVGDLLSYIRLFALGLASAILGQVFNQFAFDLAPDIPIIGFLITLIILLIGHGINIFMSGLGAFVHPLRLTFVEFYNNAGFTGGGQEYKPYKSVQVKN
jgi:V/A-type H+-transporting ATPase subunit I